MSPEDEETPETGGEGTVDVGDLPGEVSAPLPDAAELESAVEDAGADADRAAGDGAEPAAGAPAAAASRSAVGDRTRVLEFGLDGEWYCLDIEYIEEIVADEPVTRVPNTPAFVEGVVDLRGQITTIVNPKVLLDRPDQQPGGLIVVFDSEAVADGEHLGWAVDDVRQVAPVADHQVSDAPGEREHVNGIIDREDGDDLVVWTSPDLVFEAADG